MFHRWLAELWDRVGILFHEVALEGHRRVAHLPVFQLAPARSLATGEVLAQVFLERPRDGAGGRVAERRARLSVVDEEQLLVLGVGERATRHDLLHGRLVLKVILQVEFTCAEGLSQFGLIAASNISSLALLSLFGERWRLPTFLRTVHQTVGLKRWS